MANKSPFEDSLDPFQDPSITSALNSSRQDEQEGFTSGQENIRLSEDFNPTSFHHVSDNRDPFSNSTTDLNNSGSSTKIQTPANTELDAREQALLQKERELADRERDLERRNANQGPHGKNFPPCFPLFYLDINAEIPVQHQQTMWWLYREWLLFEVTLVINFIACLCLLFSHPDSVTSAPADLGISLTEMFTHTAASFFLWYRPVYNAYMKETSLYYVMYLIFNGFHILYTFYKAVGIPSTGGAGLILLVTLFSDHYWVSGVLTLLASICWLSMGVLAIYLYKKTHDHYKAAGHTFNEAKSQAYSQLGRSSTVQNAAMNAAWSSAGGRS